MPLLVLHRILVGVAILCGALFALFGASQWRATGEASWLAASAAGVVAGIGLGLYLRWFLGKRLGRKPPRG